MQLDKKLIGHKFKPFTADGRGRQDPAVLQGHRRGRSDLQRRGGRQEAAGYRGDPRAADLPAAPLTNDDPDKGGLLQAAQRRYRPDPARRAALRVSRAGHVGDKITCQQKVVDIYDKKGGALWFVVSETAMKDQAGKLVAKAKGITVVRNPDAAKK